MRYHYEKPDLYFSMYGKAYCCDRRFAQISFPLMKGEKIMNEKFMELARLAGVPEDQIIHNLDEAGAFFNGTEELKFE